VSFRVADTEGYMTAGEYPDDGLGELFLKVSKQGSTLAGIMDAFAISLSLGLQYGVPLEAYVSKFMNMRFEPAGMTDDPDVRLATSIVDYVFRRLAIDYLDEPTRRRLGIMTSEERSDLVKGKGENGNGNGNGHAEAKAENAPGSVMPGPVMVEPPAMTAPPAALKPSTQFADAPLCYNCGNQMRPAGSCFVCESCGSTSGCS
jgi:ribonucleoside-diphosphate reductase alpha chain